MNASIYMLKCPFDGTVRYIGKTECCPKHRLKQHLDLAKRAQKSHNPELYTWIANIVERGSLPVMEIIETCESSQVKKREAFYYNIHVGLGNLLNRKNPATPWR